MRTVATGAIACFVGVALVPLGLAVTFESIELGYIRFGVPAAGFFPFWIGLAVAIAGVLLVIVAWPERHARSPLEWPLQLTWFGAALAFVVATHWLGLLLSSFVFLLLTVRLLGGLPLWMGLLTATLASGLLWLVFEVWLLVPLPPGLFEYL